MSFSDYSLSWSEHLIEGVETHLRDIHAAIHQYYEREGYRTHVLSPAVKKTDETADDAALDVVSPAGSFLLRTCVQSVPFAHLQAERGVGADLVVTMPEEKCSQLDVQEGRYLDCRHAFLEEIEGYLMKIALGAAQKAGTAKVSSRAPEEDDDSEGNEVHQRHVNAAAAQRLARMVVTREHIHGAYSNIEKSILRLRFHRRGAPHDTHRAMPMEVFYVDLHFRPVASSGRIMSALAIRKHPYYSYLVLEDYLMPQYLTKMHKMCTECGGLRKALVILKVWAHHVGLMSAASGNAEGLNGFILAAIMLKLLEEGIVSPTMAAEGAARTVWVRLSHGHFMASASRTSSATTTVVVPTAEERGETAVLRLEGDVMNVLFRTSAAFMKHVVQPAAEQALSYPTALDVFGAVVYQPLQLRHDVALTVGALWPSEKESSVDRRAECLRKAGLFASPLAQPVHEVAAILEQALQGRASSILAWRTGPHTMQVLVQLTTEAAGRSFLTRGPPIEETDAVAAFNTFWGAEMTSTRQFADGAIYRCILWTFPELMGSNATAALSASTVTRKVVAFALQKHVCPRAEVQVVLGGLEGVLAERIGREWRDAALLMQKSLSTATQDVTKIITDLPRTALPCKITGFNVISASERNTEVFPVRPHLALTYTTEDLAAEKYTGLTTAPTIEPIHCVLTIDDHGKIPDTTEAIAMMKGALVAQLAKTIQQHYGSATRSRKKTGGLGPVRSMVTSQSVDIIYSGYLFRVYIAHYREVSLLRALHREAEANVTEQKLFWTSLHAKFLRSIVYGHHSYANAVRLAKRWVSAMLLGEFILPEAVELLVAHAYLQEGGGAPKTSASGFMRFVQLIATHDWAKPLVLPYTDDGKDAAAAATLVRVVGEHQGMYIATPYAATESPFTLSTPRPMIMHRLVQLAKGVVARLLTYLGEGAPSDRNMVAAIFTSDPAAFDFQMAFHPQLILQADRALHPVPTVSDCGEAARMSSGTATTTAAAVTRIWQLDEMDSPQQPNASREYLSALVEREPAAHAVRSIRATVRDRAMVFYDYLAPSSIFVVGITATPLLKQNHAIHAEILRVCRGALLPASPASFSVKSSKAVTTPCGCDGPHQQHEHKRLVGARKRMRAQSDTQRKAPKKLPRQQTAAGASATPPIPKKLKSEKRP